ncbi:flap endonuclease-1 [Methanothrix sp.]|uniref:flap endonuclease-1 n=1 Tax=Methanothrix sp. TaxID=90426 RepID=UPI0034E2F572
MGVDLGDILTRKKISIEDLSGSWIAVDGFNTLYQFLSTIRQPDGTPLMDSSGRITSHLSGLLYRMTNLVEAGIRVAFVFDGRPPELKAGTLAARAQMKELAEIQLQEAIATGAESFRYAQATTRINSEILHDSIRLLDAMGIPYVQAPSEGEAQAAFMAIRGDVDYVASQDYDSLLFGAPRVVRNLAITGRRKMPRKNVYIEVPPEVIILEDELTRLGISREQLIDIGIMCGTDYNKGLQKVGPKRALKLIKEHGCLEAVLDALGESIENLQEIRDIFLHPEVTESYELRMKKPSIDEIVGFLCNERDFSEERVRKAAERLNASFRAGQCTLERWF